jgi:hypothetical protein
VFVVCVESGRGLLWVQDDKRNLLVVCFGSETRRKEKYSVLWQFFFFLIGESITQTLVF